jgi:hypothetical protein
MSNEMKVIMERWDRFVIKEQEPEASAGPETVGQIIKSIDDLILIKGDKTKRIISNVVEALKVLIDSSQDIEYLSEDIQKIVEWFEEALEGQWTEAISAIPVKSVINIVARDPVKSFLIEKIGEQALMALVKDILPAGNTIISAAKWAGRVFSFAKNAKQAYDTGNAEPDELFGLIVKDIMAAPDNKDTTKGFLSKMNVDDEWAKMLDDKVEIEFIQEMLETLRSLPPDTPIDSIDVNQELINFLQSSFKGRAVTK